MSHFSETKVVELISNSELLLSTNLKADVPKSTEQSQKWIPKPVGTQVDEAYVFLTLDRKKTKS